MWDSDKDDVLRRYGARWREHGYDSRSLGWNKDCQWVRFQAAFNGLVDREFGSILDIGCGFGDLLGFLRERNWSGSYYGIDLVPELIEEARRHYHGDTAAEFVCGDFQTLALPAKRNLAIAIGVFNHRLRQDNVDFVRRTLETMWSLTDQAIVSDFLSDLADSDHRREDLYYANPSELYRIGAKYSRRLSINHSYMPFEFQLKVWHDDSFETASPVFTPYAHLASAQTQWRNKKST